MEDEFSDIEDGIDIEPSDPLKDHAVHGYASSSLCLDPFY